MTRKLPIPDVPGAHPSGRNPILEIEPENRPPPEKCPGCGHICWACSRCGWRLWWDTD